MGDRGQVIVLDTEEQGGVYLYTHWGGSGLMKDVCEALGSTEGRGRWNDAPYLTRIIFDYMHRGVVSPETGLGISTRDQGPDHPSVIVDVKRQEIRYLHSNMSFDEFVSFGEGFGSLYI